jgi:hypothetical protein
LVVASIFLIFVAVVAVAATLGLCPGVGLALSLLHLGGWGVSGAALRSLDAFVRQAE